MESNSALPCYTKIFNFCLLLQLFVVMIKIAQEFIKEDFFLSRAVVLCA